MIGTKGKLAVGILIDRWQPGRGGAERALADLAAWLEERDVAVDVFAVEGPRRGEHAPGTWRRVRAPLALSRGSRERALGSALVDAADAHGCDVTIGVRHLPRVDLYWPHAGSHAAVLDALEASRRGLCGGPHADEASVVQDVQESDSSRVPASVERRDRPRAERSVARSERTTRPRAVARGRHRTFLDLERTLCEGGGARVIVCVSTLVEDELARAYPDAQPRLVLVRNGVDVERFHSRERATSGARLRAALEVSAATPLVTFAARNPALKGAPALFAALAHLADRPWKLLVAGPRDAGRWRRAARDAGLDSGRVTVAAEVDPVALAAAGDLCVLPTWRDTCALVVLESLSSGTPVVTTRAAGAAASITSDAAGTVLDDPGDERALAAAIAAWLARIGRGSVDREAIRDAVRGLERETSLARMEELVRELARA